MKMSKYAEFYDNERQTSKMPKQNFHTIKLLSVPQAANCFLREKIFGTIRQVSIPVHCIHKVESPQLLCDRIHHTSRSNT